MVDCNQKHMATILIKRRWTGHVIRKGNSSQNRVKDSSPHMADNGKDGKRPPPLESLCCCFTWRYSYNGQ